MLTISLQVDNLANAKMLTAMLSRLDFVKDVNLEKSKKTNKLNPLTAEDWIKPGRPATDEETELMLDECEAEYEAGLCLSSEESLKLTLKEIREWKSKK